MSAAAPAPVPDVTPGGAVTCSECTRAAFFQARVESPAGCEHTRRRANACASHLVDVIQLLRTWARGSHLTGGWLTVLAIDPYALPRLAALGIPEPGFAFYSTPITPNTSALAALASPLSAIRPLGRLYHLRRVIARFPPAAGDALTSCSR